MKLKTLYLSLQIVYLLFPMLSQAQQPANTCSSRKIRSFHNFSKSTVLSPLEDLYDVHYVKLNLSMSNDTTFIAGNVITTAKVIAGGMNQYAFELSDSMIIDSVRFNGVVLAAQSNGNGLRTVVLPSALSVNSSFTAQVFYHGMAAVGTAVLYNGVFHNVLPTGTKVTFTSSEMTNSKDWWPVKQSLADKIDSVDLWITIPDSLKAGCNGVLTQITPMGNHLSRYEWKSRYPIDYYLISIAVAPYQEYKSMVHFTGSNDSMPVIQYLYDTLTNRPACQEMLDSTAMMIDYFSTLFGRYPFWKEKYGHCLAPNAAMENQTMTTIGYSNYELVAHELGHQWFGDHVTCGSWRDSWLNEGIASFCSIVYLEHRSGKAVASYYRSGMFTNIVMQPGGSVYVNDSTNQDSVFDNRLIYEKGAGVMNMLRYLAPDENTFFNALKNYQQTYASGTALTAQMQGVMEQAYGVSLDSFFRQWIYGEGFPLYEVRWNQNGSVISLQLTETTSKPSSVAFFELPVTIQFRSAQGDTVIKFYNNQPQQFYTFNWNKTVTSLIFDPGHDIIHIHHPVVKDAQLNVNTGQLNNIQVYPNPTCESWTVTHLPAGEVRLTAIDGKLVWQQNNKKETLIVPAQNLSAGQYILSIYAPGMLLGTQILQKQ